MISLTAAEAGRALGGSPLETGVRGVSHDTRSLQPGELFVAVRGETFDGHDFVAEALRRGATAAVVRRESSYPSELSGRLIRVADTVAALGALARAVRRKSQARVIAVTGSVGKTSTKDLLATMTGAVGPVVATRANQNNEIGVPLTLLRLDEGTRVAIVEMGMRGLGQIALLSALAEPDVALVTMIAPVHLELLGSLEEVARAKAEILSGLSPGGAGVVPLGEPALEAEAERRGVRLVRFGFGPEAREAEVWGEVDWGCPGARRLHLRWPEGRREVVLPWSSRHRYENSVAATAACWAAGLDVDACLEALPDTVFTPLRGDELNLGAILLLDDSYNANPPAMRTAVDTLVDKAAQRGGRAVAVLGDMRELGTEAERFHRQVGLYAAEAGVNLLWGIGPLSKALVESFEAEAKPEAQAYYLNSLGNEDGVPTEVVEKLILSLRDGDVVLVKASRAMRLERLVNALSRFWGPE
jgi:UDP-N-acetylmuramoyl-tripeptide--D-alanyl-D-alanine ligase